MLQHPMIPLSDSTPAGVVRAPLSVQLGTSLHTNHFPTRSRGSPASTFRTLHQQQTCCVLLPTVTIKNKDFKVFKSPDLSCLEKYHFTIFIWYRRHYHRRIRVHRCQVTQRLWCSYIGASFGTIKIYRELSRCSMVQTTKITVKHCKKMIFLREIQENKHPVRMRDI